MQDIKYCDKCGNPGPFNDKTCLSCHNIVNEFVTDVKEAYKLWLDYQHITGEFRKEMERLTK